MKTPRRAGMKAAAAKLDEQTARELAAAIRSKHGTVEEAEASGDWRELRARIVRMILDLPMWRNSNSPIFSTERAAGIARLYLARPELLPSLPPPGLMPSAD